MMNEHGKSDSCVVSTKLLNKGQEATQALRPAEAMEKRQLAKGNLQEQNTHRIQCRERVQSALKRIRAAAVKNKEQKFTALMHHIYSVDILEEAFYSLKRNVATGIDGVTWEQYAEKLTENLEDLRQRVKRGAYRAKPVKRSYIPKADGKQRPLGVFIEHRIVDKRVVRLIKKWLNAGILENGKWHSREEGTIQGGVISPLLSNIFLHYAFDLWIQQWRTKRKGGDIIVTRWADDFVVGFQNLGVAKQFLTELQTRFQKFSLTLHPEKTRLIEFGPFAINNRIKRGLGRPESFNFLGFTHIVGKKAGNGMFAVIRRSHKKRLRAKLQEVKVELRKRMHDPIPKVGEWLRSVVGGYNRYFGVPTNQNSLYLFRFQIGRYWHHALKRRGQKKSTLTWERMVRLIDRWLPKPEIHHPYPLRRMGVIT
jgi:retron-type reverse transcriptase